MRDGMQRRNRRLLVGLVAIVVGMVGLAYASVPLYDLFCRVTGFGGTTQRADAASAKVGERVVTVRFDASVNPGLPWAFQPEQYEITAKVGENVVAFYRATNQSARPTTGTATFNVTPLKAGPYFSKIDCFCFTEQRLEPGQTMQMPVSFFVDPAISGDRNLDDVKTITLSYTFFAIEGAGENRRTDTPAADQRVSRVGQDKQAEGRTVE